MQNKRDRIIGTKDCITMFIFHWLFIWVNYPVTGFTILGIIGFIFIKDIYFVVWSVVMGLLWKVLITAWNEIGYINYSIVAIKKNKSHKISTKIIIPKSDISVMFLRDLKAIKRDFSKAGSYLTTETHKLFVYNILKEFTGKHRDFKREFENALIGKKGIYKSDDTSIIVEVEYTKFKMNLSNAIKKLKLRELKEASKKIEFFDIKITIK